MIQGIKPIRTKFKLLSKTLLVENVFEFVFEAQDDVGFIPGQWANIEVTSKIWRAYSIAEKRENGNWIFYVDIGPGGPGSIAWEKMSEGAEIRAMLPLGKFVLVDSDRPKVFICTGTGAAPFIPMVNRLVEQKFDKEIYFLFGVRFEELDFVKDLFKSVGEKAKFHYVRCISRGKVSPDYEWCKPGRVTKILEENKLGLQLNDYDYYICGNPAMVEDSVKLLESKGVEHIYHEKY